MHLSSSSFHQVWNKNDNDNDNMNPNEIAVGIDFGTTNSSVSVWSEKLGRAKTIRCGNSKTMRSVVWIDQNNKVQFVGESAWEHWHEQQLTHKESNGTLVMAYKRLIGMSINSITPSMRKMFPFALKESNGEIRISCLNAPRNAPGIAPHEIASEIIAKLKTYAEMYLKCPVSLATITVPAFFDEHQRSLVKQAAEQAGLRVIRVMSEPMAVAMAYGLFIAGSKVTLVADLGGGTFDVSLLKIEKGVFETLAMHGDNALGGDDVDNLLIEYCLDKSDQTKPRRELGPEELLDWKSKCEQAKIRLSSSDYVWITNEIGISQEAFSELMDPLKIKCRNVIQHVLHDADLQPTDIDEVVVSGLSTEMKWFRQLLQTELACEKLCTNIKADRATSQGAAIQSAIMTGVDRYRLSKLLMLDALPYSIGLESGDGKFIPILKRNTTIPCSNTRRFTTQYDFQREISVEIFEGENEVARENHWVDFKNFPVENGGRYKAGERSVDVTFSVQEDGNLYVEAQTVAEVLEMHDGPSIVFLSSILIVCIAMFIASKIYFPSIYENYDDNNNMYT